MLERTYHAQYESSQGSTAKWAFMVEDLRPAGEAVSLDIYVLTIDGDARLSSNRLSNLTDHNTGEVFDDPSEHFFREWLHTQRTAEGYVPLVSLIDALPVNGVGSLISHALATSFVEWRRFWNSLCDLSAGGSQAAGEFSSVPGLGQKTIDALSAMVADPRRRRQIEERFPIFVPAAPGASSSQALAGLRVVFTGTFETLNRSKARTLAESAGAAVATSISAKCDLLVAGPGAGSKLVKAQELGLQIIDENAFLSMIGKS